MMLMMSLFAGHQEDGPGEEADAGEEAEGGQEDGPGEEAGDGQEDGQESPRAEQSGLVRGVGQVVRYVQRRAPPFGFVCSSPTRRPGGQSRSISIIFPSSPQGEKTRPPPFIFRRRRAKSSNDEIDRNDEDEDEESARRTRQSTRDDKIISITIINDFWAKFRFGFFERFLSKSQSLHHQRKKMGGKKTKQSLFETCARDASRVIACDRRRFDNVASFDFYPPQNIDAVVVSSFLLLLLLNRPEP